MTRMWMVAAAPLVLMALLFYGFWTVPSWANTISPVTGVLVLAGSFVTGLSVLLMVLMGWLRGAYALRRGDILAATVCASLDMLIPSTLALLLWLLLRSLKNSGGLIIL